MRAVSNTSPILNLAVVGELPLLQLLFHRIVVPDAVWGELELHLSERDASALFASPQWIEARSVADRPLVDALGLELDAGEAEAIALAVEMKADIVLLDERLARRVAARLGLRRVGVLGLLVEAKRRGLISSVKPILDSLVTKAGFWVGSSLYKRVLAEVGETDILSGDPERT